MPYPRLAYAASRFYDFLRATANLTGQVTGAWDKRFHDSTDEALSPTKLAEAIKEYRDQAGLAGEFPGLDGFEKYVKGRLKSIGDFSQIKAADGKSIGEKLQSPCIEAINKALNGNLAPGAPLDKALEAYEVSMGAIKKYVEDDRSEYNPTDLIDYMFTVRNDAIAAINHQHEEEIEALTKALNNNKDQIKADMGLADDAAFNKMRDEMTASLKAKHTELLDQFTKESNEPLQKLLNTQNIVEDARLGILARIKEQRTLFGGKTNALKKLEELEQKARDAQQKAHPEISFDEKKLCLKGINVKDLEISLSHSGLEIKNLDGTGSTFTMELPSQFWHPFYHSSSEDKVKLDIASLVQHIQQTGATSITMNVNNPDKDEAKKHAIKAYQACIEAGFKPEDIVVKYNGQELKPEEMATEVEEAKSTRKGYEKQIKAARKSYTDSNEGQESQRKIKSEVDKLRPDVKRKRDENGLSSSSTVSPTT